MTLDLDSISLEISGDVSRWNAAGNPIVYRLQRMDYIFDQINNNSGNIQLQFNGIDLTGAFFTGNSVYVKSQNGVYNGVGVVTSKSFSTNTLITVNIPYVSAAPGGFVNNQTTRLLYRVEIYVYAPDLTGSLAFTADQTGLVIADISGVLKANILPDIVFLIDGSTLIFTDTNFLRFSIKYKEVWSGSSESEVDDGNEYYAVGAAMQIPAPYGGNMFEFVPFDDGAPLARFLTKLDKLVYWDGYPLLISAIIDDGVSSNIYLNNLASTEFTPDGTIKVFNLKILGNTDDFSIYLNKSGPVILTETLPVEYRVPCENPIMLVARNKYGGFIQWLFEYSQQYTFDYGNDIKAKRLLLRAAGLTLNQWEALQDFISLGPVYQNNIIELESETNKNTTRVGQQAYVMAPDGSLTGVLVIPTANSTETRLRQHFFEIQIEFPNEF